MLAVKYAGLGSLTWFVLSCTIVGGQVLLWQPEIQVKEETSQRLIAEVTLNMKLSGPGVLQVIRGRQPSSWSHLFAHTTKVSIPVTCNQSYHLNLYSLTLPNATYGLRGSYDYHVHCIRPTVTQETFLIILCVLILCLALGGYGTFCCWYFCRPRLETSLPNVVMSLPTEAQSSSSYLEPRTFHCPEPRDLPSVPSTSFHQPPNSLCEDRPPMPSPREPDDRPVALSTTEYVDMDSLGSVIVKSFLPVYPEEGVIPEEDQEEIFDLEL